MGKMFEHQGFEAVQGGGRDRRLVSWSGGSERAMVVKQSYTWVHMPSTEVEVRVLANRPVALRYRGRSASNCRQVGSQSADQTESDERT
jgi:hypothetical protein